MTFCYVHQIRVLENVTFLNKNLKFFFLSFLVKVISDTSLYFHLIVKKEKKMKKERGNL